MEKKDLSSVWKSYKASVNKKDRDTIVKNYIHLVKYIAGRMSISMPDHVDFNDLLSSGSMGLLKAIDNYNPERGVPFEYFASQRIRGEILDDLRRMDWVPRSVRKKARDIEKSLMLIQNKLGRNPSDEEFAEFLAISPEELNQIYDEIKGVNLLSLHDTFFQDDDQHLMLEFIQNKKSLNPEETLEKKEMYQELAAFIGKLEERQRLVLALYYYENLTLKEIGQVLEISEARVSQIHNKAVTSLRVKIKAIEKKSPSQ